VKHLNWKTDYGAQTMEAWASRGVGGKYRVSRHEGTDGVWFEVEHLTCFTSGWRGSVWDTRPVQPVARTWREAIDAAEADNDQRRAIKKRGAA
jgi:hypothetical protein